MKPVIKADVVPHALKGCGKCTGTGLQRWIKPEKIEKLCTCAFRRFLKAKAKEITFNKVTGQLYWIADG